MPPGRWPCSRPPGVAVPDGRVVTGLDGVERAPSVASVGFFDGVHRGHQSIIRRAVRQARDAGLRSAVVTFDRHPMEVVNPGTQPKLLMTLARRARTIAGLGVDLVVVLPFDDELRHRSAHEFVEHVLGPPLSARRVVVGSNFRFGHKAAGDVALLDELGALHGFSAEGVTLLEIDGVVVSSSEVRRLLDAGEVERAARMLGRPHVVDGVVVRGDRRGVTLGFPTANVQVDPRAQVPATGVYAGTCHLADGRQVPCATNVGTNPTFGGQELRVEAHLLGFDDDLYGASVGVDFRHRIRAEQRFDGPDALAARIRADVDEARRLLG